MESHTIDVSSTDFSRVPASNGPRGRYVITASSSTITVHYDANRVATPDTLAVKPGDTVSFTTETWTQIKVTSKTAGVADSDLFGTGGTIPTADGTVLYALNLAAAVDFTVPAGDDADFEILGDPPIHGGAGNDGKINVTKRQS